MYLLQSSSWPQDPGVSTRVQLPGRAGNTPSFCLPSGRRTTEGWAGPWLGDSRQREQPSAAIPRLVCHSSHRQHFPSPPRSQRAGWPQPTVSANLTNPSPAVQGHCRPGRGVLGHSWPTMPSSVPRAEGTREPLPAAAGPSGRRRPRVASCKGPSLWPKTTVRPPLSHKSTCKPNTDTTSCLSQRPAQPAGLCDAI
jgi:hypothetical protein